MKRRVTYVIALVSMPLLLMGLFLWIPFCQRNYFEQSARRALSAARNEEELGEAVGGLGIVLKFSDGSWLAIAYDDSHRIPGWSLAIAKDSTGGFYRSKKHFCGQFMIYRTLRETHMDLPDDLADIDRLARSSDLTEAREHLKRLGFSQCEYSDRRLGENGACPHFTAASTSTSH